MSWQPAPLKHAMAALTMSPAQYDAQTLRDAIKGPGTNEKKLNEILITRDKQVTHFTAMLHGIIKDSAFTLKFVFLFLGAVRHF